MGGVLRNSPEFNLITRYFYRHAADSRCDLSIGDDAAVFTVPDGQSLVLSIDTLIEGRHFPIGFPAFYIAQRALGSALSDLAAMGAKPSHFTLALALPDYDDGWLKDFSAGLFELAEQFDVALVGGDTTKGALTVTVQVHGLVPCGGYITRSKAVSGEGVYVSGTLGDACAGLRIALDRKADDPEFDYLYQRFAAPQPRVDLGMQLRGKASALMDVSDGLLADLEQLMSASNAYCQIHQDKLPMSAELRAYRDHEFALSCALSGGDDYELLAVIPDQHADFAVSRGMTKIGDVVMCPADRAIATDSKGSFSRLQLFDCGKPVLLPSKIGFDHFGD